MTRAGDPSRWFRRAPPDLAARRETVATRHGAIEAKLRACRDGGYVVTFAALPQLLLHGATVQHARLEAQILVARYLRTARPTTRGAAERQRVLPLAA
jgi:predicted RNase H-like HicB family nuclease